jgi:hypothetical protein
MGPHFSVRSLAISAALLCLQGCSTIDTTPDYRVSTGTPSATIQVISDIAHINARVVVHGKEPCSPQGAMLAAILTNSPMAHITKRDAVFQAVAGEPITLSMPMEALLDVRFVSGGIATGGVVRREVAWYQPTVRFVPEANRSYLVNLSPDHATVALKGSDAPQAQKALGELPSPVTTCEVTKQNRGDLRIPFYLRKKSSP